MHSEENRCFQALTDQMSVFCPHENVEDQHASSIEGSPWNGILQSTWAVVNAGGRPNVRDCIKIHVR